MDYKEIVKDFITQERLAHLFGKWNEKTDNPFIKAIGDENLEKYSRFCRSFESRLGNFLEHLSQSIVEKKFQCLSTEEQRKIQKDKHKKADLCFFKNNVWNIIELKSGGNLDSKKEPAERKNLDELKLVISQTKKQQAKFYFATAYKIKKRIRSFSNDELLLGEDFWEFICDDPLSYEFILQYFSDQIRISLEELNKKLVTRKEPTKQTPYFVPF